MDKLERIVKAIDLGKPDRTPVIPFVMQFAAKSAGVEYRNYCKSGEAMAESQIQCLKNFGYDAANVSSDAHRLAEALGGELKFPRNGVPRVVEPPINSKEDLDEVEVPDPEKADRCVQRLRAIEIMKERSPEVPVIGWVEGALSDASSIFGVNEALGAFKKNPEFLDNLFSFAHQFDLKFAKAQIEAGGDIMGVGDSLASQVSPSDFQKSLKYTKKIFEDLDVPTVYHVCGDTTHQLENLKDSGADIIDLDWEVDLREARKLFGSEVCIRGNINPVLFVQESPNKIREKSLGCIEASGQKGNFILSAGCEIPPNAKDENLEAMVETAKEFTYE